MANEINYFLDDLSVLMKANVELIVKSHLTKETSTLQSQILKVVESTREDS